MRKKAVCFYTSDKKLITFDARHTASPCGTDLSQWGMFGKRTNKDEVKALKALKKDNVNKGDNVNTHLPRLLYSTGNKVRMTYVGEALTNIGGRRGQGGKHLVKNKKACLEKDLRTALTNLHNSGIQHLDLHPRNITYMNGHFNIIDFDKVRFSNDWDIEKELENVMNRLSNWSK